MGITFDVYTLFERAPTASELAAVVGALRTTVDLSGGGTASWALDPDGMDDEAIAEALLGEGTPRPSLDAGYGDVRGGLWLHSDGLAERDGRGEYEDARGLPHLVYHVDDVYFFPYDDEGEEGPIDRHRDLVDFVTRVYEAFAAHGPAPALVYGPQPATEEHHLWNPDSDVTLTAADATEDHPETAFWLQVYPPRVVEQLGADRLLSAPAWHAERLEDGAVALVVYETPTLYTDAQYSVEAVAEHLGLDHRCGSG